MANIDELRAKIAAAKQAPEALPEPPAVAAPSLDITAAPEVATASTGLDALRAKVAVAKTPTEDADTPLGDVLMQALKNIPSSAVGFGKDVLGAVTSPLETTEAIGKLIFGGIDALLPDPGEPEEGGPGQSLADLTASREERSQILEATTQHFKDRYGSIEGLKEAVATDPVGVAADVASVLIPGGGAVRGAGAVAKLPKVAKVGAAIQKVGAAIEPVQVAKQAALAGPRLLGQVLPPTKLFLSAAKITKTLPPETRRQLAQLALDERITPTAEGLEKLRVQINALGEQVGTLLEEATATGVKVPVGQLLGEFKELRQIVRNTSPNPGRDLKAINAIAKEMATEGVQLRTPQQLQKLKQSLQKRLAGLYGQINDSPANKQAQNAIAVTARRILEKLAPGIGELNKELGPRLQLQDVLTGAANRIENNDILSLRTGVTGTAGAAAGGVPGLAVGAGLGLLDKPSVKTHLAMLLNEAQRRGKVDIVQALTSLGVTTPERTEEE